MKADDLKMRPRKVHFHHILEQYVEELASIEQRPFAEVVRAYLEPSVTAKLKDHYLILAAQKKLKPEKKNNP